MKATAKRDPIEQAIRSEFPGPGNAGLRGRLRQAVKDGVPVGALGRSVALTASGVASLNEVEAVQIAHDLRLSYLQAARENRD